MRLLSPLYYRSKIDSGAAGATVTSTWIGDLALLYAFNQSLGLKFIKFGYSSHRPKYEQIIDIGLLASVAIPRRDIVKTKVFDIATNFSSEGYVNTNAIGKSARASFRNWNKRQGLAPDNEFVFVTMSMNDGLELPDEFTIRIGNTKECLAHCKEIALKDINNITLNAYTLSLILGRETLMEKLGKLRDAKQKFIEYNSPQYVLIRNFPLNEISSLLDTYN